MAGFFMSLSVKFTVSTGTPQQPNVYFYKKQRLMKIIIINGPNLNLLGQREPGIYGNMSFDNYLSQLKHEFPDITIVYYQSNIEGELISRIQETGFSYDGIILNAGAYTHTSVGIADAVKAVTTPVTEVHISNTFSRETFRHTSFLSPVCSGVIIGFGLKGYKLAIQSILEDNA